MNRVHKQRPKIDSGTIPVKSDRKQAECTECTARSQPARPARAPSPRACSALPRARSQPARPARAPSPRACSALPRAPRAPRAPTHLTPERLPPAACAPRAPCAPLPARPARPPRRCRAAAACVRCAPLAPAHSYAPVPASPCCLRAPALRLRAQLRAQRLPSAHLHDQRPYPVTIQPPLYCDTILAPVLKPLLSRYKSCIVTQPTSPLPLPGHDTNLYCDPISFKPTSFAAILSCLLQYKLTSHNTIFQPSSSLLLQYNYSLAIQIISSQYHLGSSPKRFCIIYYYYYYYYYFSFISSSMKNH